MSWCHYLWLLLTKHKKIEHILWQILGLRCKEPIHYLTKNPCHPRSWYEYTTSINYHANSAPYSICRLWCQKQVFRTEISNYIPQFTVGYIHLCMLVAPKSSHSMGMLLRNKFGLLFIQTCNHFRTVLRTHMAHVVKNYICTLKWGCIS